MSASSSMMDNLTFGEWTELARLRFEPLLEWRGKWRLTKSWEEILLFGEATPFEGMVAA